MKARWAAVRPLTARGARRRSTQEPSVRRESKPEIEVPRKVAFAARESDAAAAGWIVRLSVAGAQVESLQPPAEGSDVLLCADLFDGEEPVTLHGKVQWATPTLF